MNLVVLLSLYSCTKRGEQGRIPTKMGQRPIQSRTPQATKVAMSLGRHGGVKKKGIQIEVNQKDSHETKLAAKQEPVGFSITFIVKIMNERGIKMQIKEET